MLEIFFENASIHKLCISTLKKARKEQETTKSILIWMQPKICFFSRLLFVPPFLGFISLKHHTNISVLFIVYTINKYNTRTLSFFYFSFIFKTPSQGHKNYNKYKQKNKAKTMCVSEF